MWSSFTSATPRDRRSLIGGGSGGDKIPLAAADDLDGAESVSGNDDLDGGSGTDTCWAGTRDRVRDCS